MPIRNLGQNHLQDAEILVINQALSQIKSILILHTVGLSADEKKRLCKVRELNKMLINKALDYHENSPNLQSREIDWVEFEKDYKNRTVTWNIGSQLDVLSDMVDNIKCLSDHENYTDALRDYHYTKYKNENSSDNGYETKYDAMKAFFPMTGKTKKVKEIE